MKKLLLVCLLAVVPLFTAFASAEDSPAAIRKAIVDQSAAWNRGDVDAFMSCYKAASDTTFIGKQISHGYETIFARYKNTYSTPEAMGKLTFSELDIRMLDEKFAVVTGRYQLERSQAGGGPANGIFSLVWEKTSSGWKIILDHTS
jgi:uncharacterized protein (TIGR02246 family)